MRPTISSRNTSFESFHVMGIIHNVQKLHRITRTITSTLDLLEDFLNTTCQYNPVSVFGLMLLKRKSACTPKPLNELGVDRDR